MAKNEASGYSEVPLTPSALDAAPFVVPPPIILPPGWEQRPNWPSTFFAVAEVMAQRATCPRLRVGCVITTHDRQLLCTGYNGAPRWLPHCISVGCDLVDGHCVRAVHAELNAILQAARHGTSLENSVLYTLYQPCVRCALAMVQVGITEVWYQRSYGDMQERERSTKIIRGVGLRLEGPFSEE